LPPLSSLIKTSVNSPHDRSPCLKGISSRTVFRAHSNSLFSQLPFSPAPCSSLGSPFLIELRLTRILLESLSSCTEKNVSPSQPPCNRPSDISGKVPPKPKAFTTHPSLEHHGLVSSSSLSNRLFSLLGQGKPQPAPTLLKSRPFHAPQFGAPLLLPPSRVEARLHLGERRAVSEMNPRRLLFPAGITRPPLHALPQPPLRENLRIRRPTPLRSRFGCASAFLAEIS